MAITKKQEVRALTAGERELVSKTSGRAVKALTDTQLASMVKLVRTRRDKARTVAERQRRELRGKAKPRGATPPKADDGSRLKLTVLATALTSLNAETARRRTVKAKTSLVASARKALVLKQKAKTAKPPKARSAGKVLRGKARVEVEKHVPGSVRGSVRIQGAKAQAKRDSR
ncbi:MAG: hypothetical protein JWQ58_3530 [Reyranella sp.]|nr:hypothetical protein [Reyranella sp.]